MTWLTSVGTQGVETVVTVEFVASAAGTKVRLIQEGFPDEVSRDRHLEAWPKVLAKLEQDLSTYN